MRGLHNKSYGETQKQRFVIIFWWHNSADSWVQINNSNNTITS